MIHHEAWYREAASIDPQIMRSLQQLRRDPNPDLVDYLVTAFFRTSTTVIKETLGEVFKEMEAWGFDPDDMNWKAILYRIPGDANKPMRLIDMFQRYAAGFRYLLATLEDKWREPALWDEVMSPDEHGEYQSEEREYLLRKAILGYRDVARGWDELKKLIAPLQGKDPGKMWNTLVGIIEAQIAEGNFQSFQGTRSDMVWAGFLESLG